MAIVQSEQESIKETVQLLMEELSPVRLQKSSESPIKELSYLNSTKPAGFKASSITSTKPASKRVGPEPYFDPVVLQNTRINSKSAISKAIKTSIEFVNGHWNQMMDQISTPPSIRKSNVTFNDDITLRFLPSLDSETSITAIKDLHPEPEVVLTETQLPITQEIISAAPPVPFWKRVFHKVFYKLK
jgi:hypothetical protein